MHGNEPSGQQGPSWSGKSSGEQERQRYDGCSHNGLDVENAPKGVTEHPITRCKKERIDGGAGRPIEDMAIQQPSGKGVVPGFVSKQLTGGNKKTVCVACSHKTQEQSLQRQTDDGKAD